MAEISKATRAVQRAHGNIVKGFERAATSIADIPLGHERVDPRTHKKRMQQMEPGMDSTLTRMLQEIRNQQEPEENG